MSNTTTQTIDKLLVIDGEEWEKNLAVLKEIQKSYQDSYALKSAIETIESILSNSYPLAKIVEEAWEERGIVENKSKQHSQSYLYIKDAKKNYLSQPIKLEK